MSVKPNVRFAIFAFTLIASLFWLLLGPIFLLYRLVEIVLQPYLLKKQTKEWNEMYQNCLKQGICIDYPPTRGSLIKELPLKWLFDRIDEDEEEDI